MHGVGDTIYALSSAAGRAGVAIIRASGPGARSIIEACAPPVPPPRRAVLREISGPGARQAIDQGLVIWMPGPQSFSGEDCTEFHVHGSTAVIEALLASLAKIPGCRPAAAGEFARRAFEHGRMDLANIEGLADLIDAETEMQRRQALRQMRGKLSQKVTNWIGELQVSAALIEAGLDFSDEGDIGEAPWIKAVPIVGKVHTQLLHHLADEGAGERIRSGLKIAIVGPVNAGKSTLLNALVKRDAAIVSPQPGTTRDIIEISYDLNGYAMILFDTAGLRRAKDRVEAQGIKRARRSLADADIVLILRRFDDPAPWTRVPGNIRRIRITTQIDRAPAKLKRYGGSRGADVAISALKHFGIQQLTDEITAIAASLCSAGNAPLITRARHRHAFQQCATALGRFTAAAKTPPVAEELLAEELRAARAALGKITGRNDVEDLLDQLFASFCIGK